MKKILVIEDEARTRSLFLESLEAEGFHPIGADNGLHGVQIAQEQLPDLVICDLVMPQLDGYGVLSVLRDNPITASIPLIFLTAKSTRSDFRKGMELGADDYLTKPSTIEELLKAIAVRLEKQAVLQRHILEQIQPLSEPASADNAQLSVPLSSFPSNSQLSKVFDFIEANYHRPITLSDVAQAVGYSRTYLTNLVGSQTGKTVNRWIVEYRMAQARFLLLQTDQSVEPIAAQVGYKTVCHFFRQFRQYHGTTPQAWKKAQQTQFTPQYDRKIH